MLTPLKVNIIDDCLGSEKQKDWDLGKNCHLTKISREIGLHLQSERKHVDGMNVGIIFYTTSD